MSPLDNLNQAPASVIHVTHNDAISAADIANIVSAAVNNSMPVITQSVSILNPQANMTRITTIMTLGQLGINLMAGILGAIHSMHTANQLTQVNQVQNGK